MAVGTETDGSVTCPAALNGIVGLKPTVGLVSRTHIVPISHSQDTAGPMAATVREAALLLGGMAGSDPADEVTKAVGGGRALGLAMDVTSEASVRDAFEATVLAWGGLDILVSNAGIAHSAPVDRMALADWERSFAVNSTGHFLVAREAMRIAAEICIYSNDRITIEELA